MYIWVMTIDARKTVLNVSKLMKIAELKKDVEKEFGVKRSKQALFFRGKHLEDDCTLYDYGINLNNVIQVMTKSEGKQISENKEKEKEKSKEKEEKNKSITEEKVEEIDTISQYYKVGDAVDCTDNALGAWYEALIVKIFTKSDKLLYRVRWDLPDTKLDEPFDIDEKFIRPRAWKILNFNDLDIGHKVMLNYNTEEPEEVGSWYDFTITKIKNTKNSKELTGTVHIKNDANIIENCTTNVKLEIYKIEEPVLLAERDDDLIASRVPKTRRKIPVKCKDCQDNPRKKCKECSCRVCGEKKNPHLTLLCDECDDAYHIDCLNPPLASLPEDDDWYCPDCKVNANEIVKVGQKVSVKKKHSKTVGTTRDWGKGMACVGRTKICTLVPSNHKGAIPQVEVGTLWKFRFQVSEAGVHRPHVAGIHGRADVGAFSIVLSGGYEDDVDNGEEFLYTGSGGRDLSGNKRTAKQSSDQKLTLMNRALAVNCNAKLNDVEGAEAVDWKKGLPIRVVRNYKLAKHSKYAPKEGNRYDGIYKVVKYWPERGQSGFKVWRYLLRRDDPVPAPWTEKGKARIRELNLKMIYPEGFQEAEEKKNKGKDTEIQMENEDGKQKEGTRKRKSDFVADKMESPVKKRKNVFKLSSEISKLIQKDLPNAKLWNQSKEFTASGKQAFYNKVCTEFSCVVCQDLVYKPVTTPCAHNICLACLQQSFKVNIYACPMCRNPLDQNNQMEINETLQSILLFMFPEYDKTR